MNRVARSLAFAALLSLAATSALAMDSLQALVDATPAGGVLSPPAGLYMGSIKISKPIAIDGRGEV